MGVTGDGLLKSGALQPLEFTTDITAIKCSRRLEHEQSLIREIARFLSENEIDTLLGVAIFPRAENTWLAPQVFLEETIATKLQSITHVLPRLPEPEMERYIPTVWSCNQLGEGCCTPQFNCKVYCTNHGAPGTGYCGHRKEKTDHIGCI